MGGGGGWGWRGESGFRTPPEVVNGIGRGGSISPYGDTFPQVNHLLGPPLWWSDIEGEGGPIHGGVCECLKI
jgi:hypothetical protein